MKDYVKLQSNITITVSCGLQYEDHTRYDSDIPDRMNIKPSWPSLTVQIKKGTFWYPSEIMEWPVVKLYIEQGLISKNDESNTPSDVKDEDGTTITVSSIVEKKADLDLAVKEVLMNAKKSKKAKEESLNDLVE